MDTSKSWNKCYFRDLYMWPFCYSDRPFCHLANLMENIFSWEIKAAVANTLMSKTSALSANFKAGTVTLMNISICIWGLKSALLVKNAWFHNSSMITILTHSNKGSPLQLHHSRIISKGGHADLAFCIQATSPLPYHVDFRWSHWVAFKCVIYGCLWTSLE